MSRLHTTRPHRPGKSAPAPAQRHPLCESLEPRLALSAVVNPQGALVIIGSPEADTIVIETPAGIAGFGVVILRGVPGVADGTQFEGITRINVDLKSGNDSLSFVGLPRHTEGEAADLRILGGNGHDTIDASPVGGFLDLRGGNGSDTLTGGVSDDLIKGGKGPDQLFGGTGDDELHGQRGPDLLVGRHGDDLLLGGDGPDEHWGNQGADTIRGGKGPDVAWGGQGEDEVFGEAGSDRFNCSDDEAMDFAQGDVNFDPLFGTEFGRVLPGPLFWNRVAQPESLVSSNGVLSDLTVAAVVGVVDAHASAASRLAAFLESIETLGPLGSPERVELAASLFSVTSPWSPAIVAQPTLFTPARLAELGEDLGAAATSATPGPVATNYSEFIDTLLDLFDNPVTSAVSLLPASSNQTQAFLFGLDSMLNVSDYNF